MDAKILRGKRVLVTGGAGFIGSNLVRQLYDLGAVITILDNFSSGKRDYLKHFKDLYIIEGNISNAEVVTRAIRDQEYVINLAALPFIPDSYYFPKEFFEVNVSGTLFLAMAAMKTKIRRLVHISSSEVYGTAQYTPMDEKHPTLPHSTYAVSKLAADRLIFTMHKEHDIPAVIIRPFNTYGPNVTQPYIIPEIATQLLGGNRKVKLGNVESKRDLTYVDDTARGIISALVCDGIDGETINLGSNNPVSIEQLVKTMSLVLGKDVEIEQDKDRIRPFDVQVLHCDNRKAKRLLGWTPEVSLTQGLKFTLDWVRENAINFKAPFKGWPKSYRDTRNQRRTSHE